jgi:hypothetical protein
MAEQHVLELPPQALRDHPAVLAWSRLDPDCVDPEAIEILKQKKRKSAVYRLAGVGPAGAAIIAKRCAAASAAVEQFVHAKLLSNLTLPALKVYGCVPEPGGDYWWLFMEDAGVERYSPANYEHRAQAARWLATVHQNRLFAEIGGALPGRGGAYYLERLRSVCAALDERLTHARLDGEQRVVLQTVVAQCQGVEARWAELEPWLTSWPSALVHGDFVVKNLRLRPGTSAPVLLVFDWEMAGWGARATDLAQLPGETVSPDLEVYYSGLRQQNLRVRFPDLQRLADCGSLLRVLDVFYWETVSMVGNDREFILKPILTIKEYEPQFARAMRALGWGWHG